MKGKNEKKKINLILVLGIPIVSPTGCLGSTYPLTDKESDEIAEYVAGVLLKMPVQAIKRHLQLQLRHRLHLLHQLRQQRLQIMQARKLLPRQILKKHQLTKTSSAQTTVAETATLSEVIGIDGLNVSVDSYSILDSYSNNENREYVLYPADGDKLLIVKCTLKNTTDKDLDFSISKMFVSFVLKKMENNAAHCL